MPYIGQSPTQTAFVTDTFSGTGSTTAFTMSVAPANTSSVLVAISGVLQDPSTYSVSGLTLTFSAAPPSGTLNISARYLGIPASGVTTTAYRTVTTFTATAGQTTFSPPSYTAGFINVYRNGVLLTPTSDYTATNGTTVVLASGATAGDTVIIESFLVSSVLNAIPATAGSISSTYLASSLTLTTPAIAGSTSGSITLAAPAVAGTNTATLPAATGTVMVSGNMPAFSAYATSGQALSAATNSKLLFDTKEYDTNNNFASSRFTPTVAGYYQLNACVRPNASNGEAQAIIYKNASSYKFGNNVSVSLGTQNGALISTLAYANGSTDYFEVYIYVTNSCTTSGSSQATWFNGVLVRGA